MAVEIPIDVNRYRDYIDGVPEAVSMLRSTTRIHIQLIVIVERTTNASSRGFCIGHEYSY